MRYRLQSLAPDLSLALDQLLLAQGHERAQTKAHADALVVGLGDIGFDGVSVVDVAEDAWSAGLNSIRAAFFAVRDLAAALLDRGSPGRVVILVDPPAVRVAEGCLVSAVAGAFLTTAAQVAAVELAPRRIAVNVLVCGWTAPAPSALAAATPLQRLIDPDELAAVCHFLLSDAASAVTGAVVIADGGWSITKSTAPNPFRSEQ